MATYYVRTDGNDSNAGTGPATNQAWQTIGKAIGATGIAPGDTLYIAPGVYRGTYTANFTNPANSGQRITIQGDPTASQFSGINPNPVILTNYLSNNTSPTSARLLTCLKDYVTFNNLVFSGYTLGGAPLYGIFLNFSGIAQNFNYCHFQGIPGSDAYANQFVVPAGGQGPTIQNCVFVATFEVAGAATATAWNSNTQIKDCLVVFPSNGTNQAGGIKISSSTSGSFGGVTVSNCTVLSAGTGITATNLSASFPSIITNSNIYGALIGISATSNNGQITQTYNSITAITSLSNVASSATSVTNAMTIYDLGYSRSIGFANYPAFANMPTAYGISAGISTNAPAADFYGITWTTPSTPTIGAIETSSYTSTGAYIPTERNASTITIAPGSTSQSIELYLGATGLTASTSGLSARYNRTRTASVSIPLVARTIAQAWTSGGFAEVDATNMPGVYRLDLPDAALDAGADDVTVVVRGASGTNGAVMTIKLSSGGLTSAQTASAVWGASVAGYVTATDFGGVINETRNVVGATEAYVLDVPNQVWEELTVNHDTHGTYGWNVLRADAPSKEGLVTLHQSGGVSRVDADIHAIVNDVDAASELKGALLHNGTDYISANLLTPTSPATLLRMGPYSVVADQAKQEINIDILTGSSLPVVLQLVDVTGTGIPLVGATLSVKIYNASGTLVTTYSGTASYSDAGFLTFTLDSVVTANPGTYYLTVTRTTGATDTSIYGGLRLYVRSN